MFSKREFVTGTLAATLATTAASAQSMMMAAKPKPAAAAPKKIAHGMVKTTKLFKAPPGFVQCAWRWRRKACGLASRNSPARRRRYHLPDPPDLHEAAWLVDWNGKLLKTVTTNSRNTSGMAYGNGCVWMMANQDPEGVLPGGHELQGDQPSPNSAWACRARDGGGCHGAQWHDGKLWIVANRPRLLLARRSQKLGAGSGDTRSMSPPEKPQMARHDLRCRRQYLAGDRQRFQKLQGRQARSGQI